MEMTELCFVFIE